MADARAVLDILLKLDDKATRQLRSKLGEINKSSAKTQSSVKKLGTQLKTSWLAAAAAIAAVIAIARGLVRTVQTFAEFEKGLTNIKILMAENTEEIKLFETEIGKLSTQFGITTNSLLRSAFDIQSAVGDSAKSIDILNAATKLAVAGGSNLEDTTSGLVTLMESYGEQLGGAADASDLLFQAQVRARATIGELSSVSGQFLPLAAKLGISAEDTFAAFSKMTVALGNVNESGTAMNGVLNGLLKPTDELTLKVKEWFGVSVQQAVQQGKFFDILEKLGGVEEEELGRMLPRIRGLKGLLAVSKDMNATRDIALELQNRQGGTDVALSEQMKTTQKQLDQLKERWQALVRVLGEEVAPALLKIGNIILTILENMDRAPGIFSKFLGGGEGGVMGAAGALGAPRTGGSFGGDGEEIGATGEEIPAPEEDPELLAIQARNQLEIEAEIAKQEALKEIIAEAVDWKKNASLQETLSAIQDKGREIDQKIALGEFEGKELAKQIKFREKLRKAEVKLSQQNFQQMAMFAMQGASQSLGAIAGLLQATQGESKKHAALIKAIRIGEAVINTAMAVTSGLATQPFFPVGIAAGVLAGVLGAVQIATIASQGFAQGTDTVPSMLSPGEMVVPRTFAGAIRAGDLTLGGRGGGGAEGVNVQIENANFREDQGADEVFQEIMESMEDYRRSNA